VCSISSVLNVISSTGYIDPILAYIDLGTGSYILQVLIGSVFGILFMVKNKLRSIFRFFFGCKDKSDSTVIDSSDSKAEHPHDT
jgi:hypothetical protein